MLPIAQIQEQATAWESLAGSLKSMDFWFQIVVILFCAPIWFPILRALYREIDRSLRPEGGVFAREYTAREMEVLAQSEEPRDLPMKSVPRIDPLARARERGAAPRPRAAGGSSAAAAKVGRSTRSGGSTGRAVHTRRARGF